MSAPAVAGNLLILHSCLPVRTQSQRKNSQQRPEHSCLSLTTMEMPYAWTPDRVRMQGAGKKGKRERMSVGVNAIPLSAYCMDEVKCTVSRSESSKQNIRIFEPTCTRGQ